MQRGGLSFLSLSVLLLSAQNEGCKQKYWCKVIKESRSLKDYTKHGWVIAFVSWQWEGFYVHCLQGLRKSVHPTAYT